MSRPVRIILIDDHTVARQGLRLMLGGADDLQVSGEAETAAAALQLLHVQQFDVALLDIGLPDKNGLELLKQLHEQWPALAVLIVSMYAEDVYALRALKLGAAGYLTKTCTRATLVEAVRKAGAGGKYVSPSLLQKLADMLGGGPGAVLHEALTDRELEIFRMIASGESLVGIAAALHLSPSTVTTYRSRLLDKMGMKTNAELTRYGLDYGLLG
ncbi:response regulator transcription factor [Massilia sp. DJPM01]|uniref:response regulator transcription factor n=1 Tax=Massilia sp. DJPM01 TaxID=3024404 RepID=UPI00259DE0CC|nr:response regulator transcription factor [Massilia sp. DJPM01]MDM5177579.1 response regulator transcription factor [Massilia sp. DJPM01]